MKVSVRVIQNYNGVHDIERAWNTLIDQCSNGPILLSGFVEQFTKLISSSGWAPLLLAISVDGKLVGISPLKVKKKFGFRLVKFLPRLEFSQDFVIENQYREICISHTIDFLFKTLKSQLVSLTLPGESLNLQILKQKCKASGIQFGTKPEMGHRILPVEGTWEEFETLRGGNFRRKLKKIARNLDRVGSWKITCLGKGNEGLVAKKMLDVERVSWKEGWRSQAGMEVDQDLLMVWNGSQQTTETDPSFNWNVWFLDLNDQTLAYALVFQYKEVAFIVKTSYDERYKKLYPGIFIVNEAIRELFGRGQVKKIDFLTDLPFMETWTSLSLPRVGAIMSRKNILQTIIRFAFANEKVKSILNMILTSFSKRARSITDFLG
jgi:hypothetical protein